MFYSHEILTSQKYGVATVWLVATLGSRSNLRKITRKAILDVNVPKACETITDPLNPMALRLQGSLLYGLSRVYSQQCGYVLTDMQHLKDKMRGMKQILKDMELDPDIVTARNTQLNLPEDPAFNVDLDINFDLSAFDISTRSGGQSDTFSPCTAFTSQSFLLRSNEHTPSIILPSTSNHDDFGVFNTDFEIDFGSTSAAAESAAIREESGFIENPDFIIDDEGRILEIRVANEITGGPTSANSLRQELGADSGLTARIQGEHVVPINDEFGQSIGDDVWMVGDDDERLVRAELLDAQFQDQTVRNLPSSLDNSGVFVQETTAVLPQLQQRAVKQISNDAHPELSNKELSEWNEKYLENMAKAHTYKKNNRSLTQAKKYAAFWIEGQGIGQVKVKFGDDRIPHPLAIFSGRALLDALSGTNTSSSGSKRSYDEIFESDDASSRRRVRSRNEEQQFDDDDGLIIQGDDIIESQIGREAPSSLRDRSSAMPWNLSAPRHESAQLFGSGGTSVSSNAMGTIARPPPSSISGRRNTRVFSASPLLGKGQPLPRLSNLEISDDRRLSSQDDDYADLYYNVDDNIDGGDFQFYGPAATVDTQTAAQSQWITSILEDEAYNFLDFVHTKIKENPTLEDIKSTTDHITFHDLLPPIKNTKVVGAQGLLHVLALATKGLIEVNQIEPYGVIEISRYPNTSASIS